MSIGRNNLRKARRASKNNGITYVTKGQQTVNKAPKNAPRIQAPVKHLRAAFKGDLDRSALNAFIHDGKYMHRLAREAERGTAPKA